MGANTKLLRSRIKSVDSTLHLTKAMGLVASSKIRRANEAMAKSRQYANAVSDAVSMLTTSPETAKSPYLAVREEGRTRLIVIAGDRGLAGGYNANVFRLVATLPKAEYIAIGKRACDRFGGANSSEDYSSAEARALAKTLCEDFANGAFDKLGIVYTTYQSMMTQTPVVKWVLPLERGEAVGNAGIVFEPDEQTILPVAVLEYVAGVLLAAVRESFASEVAARRMAMDSAGKNAQEMIADLQLQYNRARQGAITQEITEIVAGSGE